MSVNLDSLPCTIPGPSKLYSGMDATNFRVILARCTSDWQFVYFDDSLLIASNQELRTIADVGGHFACVHGVAIPLLQSPLRKHRTFVTCTPVCLAWTPAFGVK
jgi:hypothetical protein